MLLGAVTEHIHHKVPLFQLFTVFALHMHCWCATYHCNKPYVDTLRILCEPHHIAIYGNIIYNYNVHFCIMCEDLRFGPIKRYSTFGAGSCSVTKLPEDMQGYMII